MTAPKTAILAHGKNWELPIPPDPQDIQLSIESKMTAEAAGVLFTEGVGDLIFFSGGHTAGSAYPSEAATMMDAMREHFDEHEVPPDAVKLEQASYDTASNLSEIKDRLPDYGIDRLVLVTIGYHLPRVRRLAQVLDVPISEAFRSDYVIRERHGGQNHLYGRTVINQAIGQKSMKPLVRTTSAYGLEAVGWGVSLIDPRSQHLGKFLTSKARHQD